MKKVQIYATFSLPKYTVYRKFRKIKNNKLMQEIVKKNLNRPNEMTQTKKSQNMTNNNKKQQKKKKSDRD